MSQFRPLKFTSAVLAFSLLISLNGCEKKNDSIIDSVGLAPTLSNGLLNPSVINTDSINIGPERKPDDLLTLQAVCSARVQHPSGPAAISSVTYSVLSAITNGVLASGGLSDDGIAPDQTKGDGVYTGAVVFQIQRSDIGTFRVELASEGHGGFQSNSVLLPLRVVRLNRPPVLSNLQAPDTVKTSLVSQFLITATAFDPDGLADIKTVTRTTPSGLVLQLNDQGLNGDVTAGDGVYTETVSVSPSLQPGPYPFKFQAVDRSNDTSNVILHTILIKL